MSEKQSSVLTLEGPLSRTEAVNLRTSLAAIWEFTYSQPLGELFDDLETCRSWFDPVAQGQRLRRGFASLPPVPGAIRVPGAPFTFSIGDSKHLLTPEGRCAIDLLDSLPDTHLHYLITDHQLLGYDRILAKLYREWSQHRIRSVVELLAGEAKPLQLPAAGVVLALLVNRSTSAGRALKRFPAGSARDVIDQAFFKAIEAFWTALTPKQRPTRNPRLISGWMLYEARRRLGDEVLVVEDSRPDTAGSVWIAEDHEVDVLKVVARDLSRGHRSRIGTDELAAGFDELVTAFRSELPRLAGYGLAHERPTHTKKVRKILLDRFEEYSTSDSS